MQRDSNGQGSSLRNFYYYYSTQNQVPKVTADHIYLTSMNLNSYLWKLPNKSLQKRLEMHEALSLAAYGQLKKDIVWCLTDMCSVHVENSNFVAFRKPKLASLFVLSSYFIIRRLGLCANMSSCKRVAEGIRRRGSIWDDSLQKPHVCQ